MENKKVITYIVNTKSLIRKIECHFATREELKAFQYGVTIGYPGKVAVISIYNNSLECFNASDAHMRVYMDAIQNDFCKSWRRMVDSCLNEPDKNSPYSDVYPEFIRNENMGELLCLMGCMGFRIMDLAYDPSRKEFVVGFYGDDKANVVSCYYSLFHKEFDARIIQYFDGTYWICVKP